MIRLASVGDAGELERLNAEFNGKGKTTEESIRASLLTNRREVVIVADGDGGRLAGFVCVQLKKSFCYDEYMPEITEVYVRPEYRGRGVAREMLTFAQEYCKKIYPLHSFELLTGSDNTAAQKLYSALGFERSGEIHRNLARDTADYRFQLWSKAISSGTGGLHACSKVESCCFHYCFHRISIFPAIYHFAIRRRGRAVF